ncbi:MAG: pyruvate formate lyase family protein, partial [Lachnospiraceae bacterium]|nr:pyruvate formate lyase family protein [Lachnospiraceae bacterium]
MTVRIRKLRKFFIEDREHFALRQEAKDPYRYAARYAAEGLDDLARSVRRLSDGLSEEKPHVFPDEKIALIRTVRTVPEIHTEEETAALRKKHYFHEQGKVCNVSPDYAMLLARGFDAVREEIGGYAASFRENGEEEKARYEEALLAMLDTVSGFAQRYREEALRAGNAAVAESFSQIPAKPPRTFLEALQFLRLIHYTLWMCWHYHNTFGRFDQYMEPYFRADLEKGILTEEGALELIEEFFLSLNRDSDMYPGMQQGDNGQSMVLGGITKDGSDGFGLLSELCLKASLELKLADPKINVRVNKNTPVEEYIRCTELTKAGLGFPQYSNDDVVIPGLLSWGYRPEDAREYVVAACWEFIIPGYGMDIPNVDSLSFPACVLNAVQRIGEADTFEDLMEMVHGEIDREAARLRGRVHDLYLEPAPFLSLMMHGA